MKALRDFALFLFALVLVLTPFVWLLMKVMDQLTHKGN